MKRKVHIRKALKSMPSLCGGLYDLPILFYDMDGIPRMPREPRINPAIKMIKVAFSIVPPFFR